MANRLNDVVDVGKHMAIVVNLGNIWIESHDVDHGQINSASADNKTFNLDKPGRVVAIVGQNYHTSQQQELQMSIREASGGNPPITFNNEYSSLQSTAHNNGGSTITSCHHYILVIITR